MELQKEFWEIAFKDDNFIIKYNVMQLRLYWSGKVAKYFFGLTKTMFYKFSWVAQWYPFKI